MTSRLLLAVLLLLPCCAPVVKPQETWESPPTAQEIAKWRESHGFVAATEEDLAQAKAQERPFVKERCVSPDGKLRLVWRGGKLVGSATWGASATSVYELTDASGKVLLSAPSRLYCSDGNWAPGFNVKCAWFSPDGKKVLLSENVDFSCSPVAILFFKDEANCGGWTVGFMDMGETLNQPYSEGDNPECRGMNGEWILIRNVYQGVSKIPINKLQKTYPFPYAIG